MGKNGFDFVKIDKTVINETKYVAAFVGILSMLMQAIFLIIGKWHYAVLLGNIWGAAVAIGNFFVMAIYVQKAVEQEAEDAKKTVKASQSLRFAAMVLLIGIGVAVLQNNYGWIGVVVPLLFPGVAAFLRPITNKNK